MTDDQNVAYINSQVACAMITAMGMQAENQQRIHRGESLAYVEQAFLDVLDRYGIHHNAVIGSFHHG